MSIKRREFLAGSLAGLSSLILNKSATADLNTAGPAGLESAPFDPYEMVPLGKTGLKVSRVGIGTGMKGFNRQSNQTRLGKEKFQHLLRTAYERGIRLFDMADLYGSHPYLIPALEGIARDKFYISTKIWYRERGLGKITDRPDADVVVERFLKELKTDYIDLVLMHCMTSNKWNTEKADQMDILAKLKKKGVIRAHGVSVHSLPALKIAAEEPWVDSVHTRINPYGNYMDDKPGKVIPVINKIHENGKGVVGMKIIGQGDFRDSDEKRNKSIELALNLGCVDTMIVGFESVNEIDDFAARVRKTPRRKVSPNG